MPLRLRVFFSVLTSTLLFIPALALYRELSRRPDIWWTPPAMALSLNASQDRVRIYVRGKPLGALLEAKQLWIGGKRGLVLWIHARLVCGSTIGTESEQRGCRCS